MSDTERPEQCRAFVAASNYPVGCNYPLGMTAIEPSATIYFVRKWRTYQRLLREYEWSPSAQCFLKVQS